MGLIAHHQQHNNRSIIHVVHILKVIIHWFEMIIMLNRFY